MKKALGIFPVLMIALALTACGGNKAGDTEATTEAASEAVTEASTEAVSEQTTLAVSTQAATQAATNAQTQTTTKAPAAKTATKTSVSTASSTTPKVTPVPVAPTPAVQTPAASTPAPRVISTPTKKDLGLTLKGNKILLNSNMSEVAPLLGSTTNYSEEPSKEFSGKEKTFTYGLVNIYTYPHSTGDYIDEIEINDPAITTDTGLAPIGKNISEVKAVYGEPSFFDSSFYVYEAGDCYTYYSTENDIVKYWGVVLGYIL